MVDDVLRTRLISARAAVTGDLTSTSRVVDALLDLRQLAADRAQVVELVDDALASMPGRTVVRNEWYLDRLDRIEAALASTDAQRPEPTTA